jgi:hypothetical protein
VRVHLAGEHPPELEPLDFLRDGVDLADEIGQRPSVLLLACELVELGRLAERLLDLAQRADYALELGALAAEILGALGVGPNVRIFELAVDLFETLALRVEVKGTSAERRCALEETRWRIRSEWVPWPRPDFRGADGNTASDRAPAPGIMDSAARAMRLTTCSSPEKPRQPI